jgi:hypothetical protein
MQQKFDLCKKALSARPLNSIQWGYMHIALFHQLDGPNVPPFGTVLYGTPL